MADKSLFSGPHTKRQIAAYIVFACAMVGAIVGLWQVRDTVEEAPMVLLVTSIGVLCGVVIYMIATEDRGTGLVTEERRESR